MSVKSMHTALMEMAQNQSEAVAYNTKAAKSRLDDRRETNSRMLKRDFNKSGISHTHSTKAGPDGSKHDHFDIGKHTKVISTHNSYKVLHKGKETHYQGDPEHRDNRNRVIDKVLQHVGKNESVKMQERASWVPEAITDEDAANFMGAAAAAKKAGKSHFDFGGKKYKVTMKHDAAKKIGESAECPTCGDGECQCEQPVEEAKIDEVSYKTAMKSYQKAMGQSKDADDAGDKETGDKKFDQAVKFGRYATKKFKSSRNKKKLVSTLRKEETVEVEENYTDKQDASYRDEPTPKGAQKRLKALHKKALAYRKKHGVFPSVRKRQKDLAMKKAKSDLKFESVEEAVSVKKQDYKWGRMMTVHHGKSHSYPLHPEHQSAIKKLSDDQKTSFKDETGTKVTAHRQGDTVHLSSSKTNKKTPVAHSHFTESVNEAAGTAQHKPTPETSDTWDKQLATRKGEKDFIDQHTMDVALDAEKIYQQNKYEALSQTPARRGDQKVGDKNPVNPVKANPIEGMRKVLAGIRAKG